MTRAYQLAQTSYAAIFEYAYLISVGLCSWLFWGIIPNYLSAIGILLIIFAGVMIVLAPQKPSAEQLVWNDKVLCKTLQFIKCDR